MGFAKGSHLNFSSHFINSKAIDSELQRKTRHMTEKAERNTEGLVLTSGSCVKVTYLKRDLVSKINQILTLISRDMRKPPW